MVEATNCLAVIDEAHMWFSARKWTSTEQADLAAFQQHRKEGMDVIWIAQHESRVDVAIRELTAFIWRHRRLGRFVIASKVTPDEPKKALKRKCIMIRPELYNNFFTEERIGFRDGTGYKFGAGNAYKRSAGRGPALDENNRLAPNYFRLETPGSVRYLPVDSVGISEAVAFALAEWRVLKPQAEPEDFCRPVYRGADKRFHLLDPAGTIVPNEAQKDMLDQARELLEDMKRLRLKDLGKLSGVNQDSFFRIPPKKSSMGSMVQGVKSEAAAPMPCAEPVPQEDLTPLVLVPKAIRFGGSGSVAT